MEPFFLVLCYEFVEELRRGINDMMLKRKSSSVSRISSILVDSVALPFFFGFISLIVYPPYFSLAASNIGIE